MRIVELPLPLSPDSRLALTALVERDHRMNVGWQLHLGNTYDFTGPIEASSYNLLAVHNRFAWRGSLELDYPATTHTVDDVVGLTVLLSGPDIILDEQSAFAGVSNDLLVFVGDEIMSVIGYELQGAGRYRLFVIRERLTSERESHVAGTDVYLIRREDILPLSHSQVQVGNELTFKLLKFSNGAAQSLSDLPETTHTVTGVMLFQLAPSNLRVNDQNRNAFYTAGQDVRLDWSLPDARAEVASVNTVKFRSLVEIVSAVDETVLYSKLTFAGTFKILAAKMATILGAETDFIARITTDGRGRDFSFQSTPVELYVTQL